MRSQEWFEERPARVVAVIEKARKEGGMPFDLVYRCFREICDDPPDESDARLLASVLAKHLTLGEFVELLEQVRRFLRDLIDRASAAMEESIEARSAALRDQGPAGQIRDVSIGSFALPEKGSHDHIARVALAFQTLAWVVCPPADRPPQVIY